MPEQFKPTPVVLVSGTVLDPTTGKPVLADIVYSDLETGEEIGRARSSPVDGKHQIALPSGRAYAFSADQEGYFGENRMMFVSLPIHSALLLFRIMQNEKRPICLAFLEQVGDWVIRVLKVHSNRI